MLKSYKASISFLEERVRAFGVHHKSNVTIKNSELLHLSSLFRAEELAPGAEARASMTELIQYIRTDNSGVFSEDERKNLMEAAVARLGGETSDDITSSMHGSQKSQTHLASHNYLTSEQWDFLQDETKSLKLKQTYLSKVWLKWGLRFPSAPTFRSGLALLMVSSKCDSGDPVANFQHLEAFTTEFRKLRSLYPGEPSVKKFHEDPADFKKIHPTLLEEYVECRVNVADILETAHKRAIPCKRSNSSLAGSSSTRPSASPSSSSSPSSRDSMMLNLLQFALQGGNNLQLSPPSADRRRGPVALTMSPGPAPKASKVQAIADRKPPDEHGDSEEVASLLCRAPASETEGENEEPADLDDDQVAQQTAAFIAERKKKNKREKEKAQAKLAQQALAASANQPGAAIPITRRITGKTNVSKLALSVLAKQRKAANIQASKKRPAAKGSKNPMTLEEVFKKMVDERSTLSRNAFCSRAYSAGKTIAKRSGKNEQEQIAFAKEQHAKASKLWADTCS
jgi:hypothetical protein